ncbi:MAG: arylsulfatase [Verrucomicrobiales bacterium]|nr:arylsulfatase [Verrucomicrobiales bacterium]
MRPRWVLFGGRPGSYSTLSGRGGNALATCARCPESIGTARPWEWTRPGPERKLGLMVGAGTRAVRCGNTRTTGGPVWPRAGRRLIALACAVSWAAAASVPARDAGGDPSRPNFIFILADDLGYGDLGCYGQRLIRTPCLDRMAREGTRFTHCYAGSPVCAPSRNALMTGQHTGHARVRDNSAQVGGVVEEYGGRQRRVPLADEDVTIAEVLKASGYVTGVTGKWGLGEPDTPGVPNRQGFDEWFGYLNQNHAADYYTTYLWKNETRHELPGNHDGRKTQYTHDLFTEFALDFIRRHRARPFFLYLAYTIPHDRLEVPDLGDYAAKPWPAEAKIYAAMISRLDRDVGRILDLLEELGLSGRTLVFLSSDNGAPARPWGNLFGSLAGFRGKKGELYEGGIRVPMLVRWPGRVPARRVNDAPWYFPDVLPTLATLAGVTAPPCDGLDISPLLLGRVKHLPDRFLYWEFPKRGLNQAVRWGRWKAVRPAGRQTFELFDLKRDPAERNNLAAEHPDVLARIEAYAKTARVPSPHWPD